MRPARLGRIAGLKQVASGLSALPHLVRTRAVHGTGRLKENRSGTTSCAPRPAEPEQHHESFDPEPLALTGS